MMCGSCFSCVGIQESIYGSHFEVSFFLYLSSFFLGREFHSPPFSSYLLKYIEKLVLRSASPLVLNYVKHLKAQEVANTRRELTFHCVLLLMVNTCGEDRESCSLLSSSTP